MKIGVTGGFVTPLLFLVDIIMIIISNYKIKPKKIIILS